MFIGMDGKGGQKGIFSVCTMSEFYPLDFECIYNIIMCILNFIMELQIVLMDRTEIINAIDIMAVSMAQTPSSNNIHGMGSQLV